MGLETGALGSLPQFSYAIDKWPQEKLKTMLMQNSGVTNKEYYGMLWYFLEWSIESSGPRTWKLMRGPCTVVSFVYI